VDIVPYLDDPFQRDAANPAALALVPVPLPHPQQPRSTAKRGTRRTPPALRRYVLNGLGRADAAAALSAGVVSAERAKVVWNVGGRAVVQPLAKWAIPPGEDLLPARRIGTYRDAPNRIGMYPIIREGRALHLCAESRLEMGWFRALDIDPTVTWMHAQPFLPGVGGRWEALVACLRRVGDPGGAPRRVRCEA